MKHPCIFCGEPVVASSPEKAICECATNKISTEYFKAPQDDRMYTATCPLCASEMRPLFFLDHEWGDFGRYQCPECAAMVQVCNNTARKKFVLKSRVCGMDLYSLVETLTDEFIDDPEWAPLNTHKDKKREADKKAHEEDERRRKCVECEEMFLPHIRARCDASKEYCSKCRKEIPLDDPRWVYDDNGPK